MVVTSDLKAAIRRELINKRQKFDQYLFKRRNDLLYQQVMGVISGYYGLNNIEGIGLYWPIKGEPDLLKIALRAKSYVGLPSVDGAEMIFARYKPGDYVEKSKRLNLYQPVKTIEMVPALIIVPGLGFSVQGYRIGYGRGYYDKYLDKISASKPITIGVCFHDNLFEYLPFEQHDHQFDYVVTDKIIITR